MEIPSIVQAVVLSQSPDDYAVNVMILGVGGGQMPSLPVKVSTHGPRDALRGNFPELPLPGHTGIVAFPRGDIRNGTWLGTMEPALTDASPYAPGQAGISYTAKFSGGWSYHGPDGTTASVLPDGTEFLAGTAMPEPTRHTLDKDQKRQRTPFTLAERRPVLAGALPMSIRHSSGTTVQLSASGGATVNVKNGESLTVVIGGSTLVMSATGLTVTTPTFTVDGNVVVSGDINADGGIVAGSSGGGSVTMQHHRHPANNTPPTPGT